VLWQRSALAVFDQAGAAIRMTANSLRARYKADTT
jgi:hypothetical protein